MQHPPTPPQGTARPSKMKISDVLNESSNDHNGYGPTPKRQHLQSKGSPTQQRQAQSWEMRFLTQNHIQGAYTRADHPIYHDEFYLPHIRMINELGRRISRFMAWIDQVRGPRTRSRDLLESVHSDILKMVQNPAPANLEDRANVWELQIQALGSGYEANQQADGKKYGEWRSIKGMLDGVKSSQKHMKQTVIKNLPKFFWRSSAPLKRMLELDKQILRFESHLNEADANLARILAVNDQISVIFKKCHQALMGVIDVMLKNMEGSPSQEAHTTSDTKNYSNSPGALNMQEPKEY
ncbi:hypothetical protein TWF506_009734 [Arthrobotrys conoides]|uniref:Uncharacterized protein n=1 Tax=Arthrobotrys conoides TaxID=74498 RepID=A0AAN8NJ04_9PEZI